MAKGNIPEHLLPRKCINCKSSIKLNSRACHLDFQMWTEDMWRPYVDDNNTHLYWVFCSIGCVIDRKSVV